MDLITSSPVQHFTTAKVVKSEEDQGQRGDKIEFNRKAIETERTHSGGLPSQGTGF